MPTPTPPTSSDGEPDQAEELGQPIEPEADAAAGIGQPLHPPAGVAETRRLIALTVAMSEAPGGRRRRYSQLSRLPGWTRPDSATRLERDHEPRAEAGEGIEPAVGLAGDEGADLDRDLAHLHASPSAMFMRLSAASSTTAPHTPSRLASASASDPPPFSSTVP